MKNQNKKMNQIKQYIERSLRRGLAFSLGAALLSIADSAFAHDVLPVPYNPIGIPYAWELELSAGEVAATPPDHVGAWSWDEDGFPATTKGWTHTSKWVLLNLTTPALFTLTLSNFAGVPWPSVSDTNRLAGTNLYPSFTLYKGWDLDAGITFDTNGVSIDQDHTFNNRGNIAWAEDVQYLDHLENTNTHSATRTWLLPAGQYTINLGGNSPAIVAEGQQGYIAIFAAAPAPVAISNAALSTIDYDPVGIPYGIGLVMDSSSSAETLPDHVGAWSWDEDGFPATARGWTHTSKWVKLDLLKPASFTLTLSSLANVPWPSAGDPGRLAGTNLYPSFTLYRGWDTDAGITFDLNGVSIDQDHTFNNRGNIEWAEDVTYYDHLENTNSHTATRTWNLPAGQYTINLGGNSPATIAEGQQGYKAVFTTTPAAVLLSGLATIHYDQTAWNALAANFSTPPVLTLSGFFDQAAANAVTPDQLLTNAQSGYSYVNQFYAMNGLLVTNLPGRTTQPTTFGWVPGNPTRQTGGIGLGGVARFAVLGGLGGSLLYGDYTLQYDTNRLALGGTGWYLKGNIPPAVAAYDLLNVTVVETTNSLHISGDLGVSFEVANFLYATPADTLKDVGDFNFTGYTVPLTTPTLSVVSITGGNLVLRGANGLPGSSYVLLSTTNVTAPLSVWTPAATGVFDASGASSNAIPINPAQPARFFRVRQP